ncbi:hypothetical protein [Nocardioides astragali]|uniref:Uncharacterized protein n=1 Tax=Nocardioides astragali TaxID=1776736 RepID=A0ABW2MV05_9ACTN|nr:hypothetical protein [Nocardioides astragali]
MKDPLPRRWPAHVLASVVVGVAAFLAFVGTVMWMLELAVPCVPDYSESVIIAPDSYRGRVLCSVTNGELGMSVPALTVLGLLPAIALAPALSSWIRHKRFVPMVPWLLVAILLPWGIRSAVHLLPADCSAAQRSAHGAAGCERDEEQRPGLGQY